VNNVASWEGFHGQWPAVIVQQLLLQLPAEYVAEPRVHRGSQIEIDVATYRKDDPPSVRDDDESGVAVAVWAPAAPSLALETTLADFDAYEVLIYDIERGRRLVAAIEIVSPANKDRPEHRGVFVAKCASLLQKGIAVSVVDLVTVRQFNLYADLLTLIGHGDPALATGEIPHTYAASCRWVRKGRRTLLQIWSHELILGQPLPTLPLWLTEDLAIPLELESSYEKACRDLRSA